MTSWIESLMTVEGVFPIDLEEAFSIADLVTSPRVLIQFWAKTEGPALGASVRAGDERSILKRFMKPPFGPRGSSSIVILGRGKITKFCEPS